MRDRYREEIISPGDRASARAKEVCYRSHHNCPALSVVPLEPDNFRGPVGFVWRKHVLDNMRQQARGDGKITQWSMLESVENDGAGGKPQFFTLAGTEKVFRNLGWEIITMNADDFARSGRFPAVIANALDVKSITDANFHLFEQMMAGYEKALHDAGLVNITGETAIMKHSITAFCDADSDAQLVLTWGGTCIGLTSSKLRIDPSLIKPDMPIIGFWEPGYRCTGGTFLTNLILEKWGPDPLGIMKNLRAMAFIKKLTVPSRSYARTISRIVGWRPDGSIGEPLASIAGIAHITGGGVWGKFGELLPEGVGAFLSAMPKPAKVLLEAQELSLGTQNPLTDWQAYGTFHGGCGMLIVCEADSVPAILEEARKDGVYANVVGKTFASGGGEILIQSKFKEGKTLASYKPE